jgi:hypothetical protein
VEMDGHKKAGFVSIAFALPVGENSMVYTFYLFYNVRRNVI